MNFAQRTAYFEMIATRNKLVAHDQVISGGRRASFFRINDEVQLNAACVNWVHFPCIVHLGHSINYRQNETGLPRKVIGNHLYILTRLDLVTHMLKDDAIQAAYEAAETVLDQVIGFMNEEMEATGACGENLFRFNANRAKADQVGPINETLYGWYFVFQDETNGSSFKYDPNNWQ